MRTFAAFGIVLLIVMMIFTFGCERKVVNESGNVASADARVCFACHSDQDRAITAAQDEYATSVHASGDNTDRNRYGSSFYKACEQCHTAEGFLANLQGEEASGDHFTQIGCFTCHAPHTNGNLTVRVTNAVTLLNGAIFDKDNANLCASCHHSRADVNTYVTDDAELSTHWGPHHSVQSDMLVGTNGYEYTGYSYSNSPHSNVVVDGCVTCHMSASADLNLGGHSWSMESEKGQFNRTGCNLAQCHNGAITGDFEKEADEDYDRDGTTGTVQEEIAGLLDSLALALEDAGLLDEEGEPLEITVPDKDSAGAVFNYIFVHEDRSIGVHNTEYAAGLLISALNYMETGNPEGIPSANRQKAFTELE